MADEKDNAPKKPVDLAEVRRQRNNEPFFAVRRPEPWSADKCEHASRGFEYDPQKRRVWCKCGDEVDAFDALVAYAHSERRLQETREFIEADQKKKADEKAKRPFVRKVGGWSREAGGFAVRLECRHEAFWSTSGRTRFKNHPPRTMTCEQCIRTEKLKEQGVAVVGGSK